MDDQAWVFHIHVCPRLASLCSASPAWFCSSHCHSLCLLRFRALHTVPHKIHSSFSVSFLLQGLLFFSSYKRWVPAANWKHQLKSHTFMCDSHHVSCHKQQSLEISRCYWSFLALAELIVSNSTKLPYHSWRFPCQASVPNTVYFMTKL